MPHPFHSAAMADERARAYRDEADRRRRFTRTWRVRRPADMPAPTAVLALPRLAPAEACQAA